MQDIHHTVTNEYFMLFTILATGELTSPVDTGAVIGGTIPGFIALMALVIFLFYKIRKRRKFYIRYIVIQHTSLKRTLSFEMQ